jgi:uncharacterized protein (DUF1499 family)
LTLTDDPNQFLVCPEGYCLRAEPHLISPVYDASIDDVRQAWDSVVAAAPRTKRMGVFADGFQVVDVQRSAILRFPDVVTTQFIRTGDNGVMLAVYSRSVYGKSDFGVNEKRITAWLQELAVALEKRAHR